MDRPAAPDDEEQRNAAAVTELARRRPADAAWREELARRWADVERALRWLVRQGDSDEGLRLGNALFAYWHQTNRAAEGREWLERLARLQPHGRTARRAFALDFAGLFAARTGDVAGALPLFREALDVRRELVQTDASRGARVSLWQSLMHVGNTLAAGSRSPEAHDSARRHLEEGLAMARALGDPSLAGIALANLSRLAMDQGDSARAETFAREVVGLARETEDLDPQAIIPALACLAGVAAAGGSPVRALRLAGAAASLQHASGAPASVPVQQQFERWVAPARAAVGGPEAAAAWRQGERMPLPDVIAYALGSN
jgi:tetratricopeptide (TPR) repeat protein